MSELPDGREASFEAMRLQAELRAAMIARARARDAALTEEQAWAKFKAFIDRCGITQVLGRPILSRGSGRNPWNSGGTLAWRCKVRVRGRVMTLCLLTGCVQLPQNRSIERDVLGQDMDSKTVHEANARAALVQLAHVGWSEWMECRLDEAGRALAQAEYVKRYRCPLPNAVNQWSLPRALAIDWNAPRIGSRMG